MDLFVSGLTIDGTGVVAVYDDAQAFLGGMADFELNQSYSGKYGTVEIDAQGNLTWIFDDDTDGEVAWVRVSGPQKEDAVTAVFGK